MDKKYQVFKIQHNFQGTVNNEMRIIAVTEPLATLEDAELVLLNLHNDAPYYAFEFTILTIYTHK